MGFPGGAVVKKKKKHKNPPANVGGARDTDLILGLGRSPGERNGYLLQYSCLENSIDRGVWWAPVHEVTKSQMAEQLCVHMHTHTHTHTTDYHMQGVMGTFLEVKALLITTWGPGLEGANDDGIGPASLQQQLVPRLKRGHMARQEEGLFAQGQLASLDYFCYFSVLVNPLLDAPLP